ncbi:MAG: AraC-like DNA-binding protein [Candidatus Pelagisphaera sp.]|jgi:AraC-like DNA-binding protein
MIADSFSYLPQSEEPSAWNLRVLGAGQTNIKPNQPYPSSEHPSDYALNWEKGRSLPAFQVLYITRGSGLIETAETSARELKAPFIFLLFPEVWHRYRPSPETGWQEHWIGFDGPIPQNLLETGIINPKQPFFEVGHHDSILALFQLVLDEVKNEALGFRRIAAASVLQILALATSLPLRQEEENQPMRAVIRQASFLLRERTDANLSVETLADELNVGYTYFRRLFKKYTGFSPKQYHTQLRFERVKRLLSETELSIGEIANLLNFDSTFHLSQWFKKLSGLPPSSWRQNSR